MCRIYLWVFVLLTVSSVQFRADAQSVAHERCQALAKGQNLNNWLEASWDTDWPSPTKYNKQHLVLMQEAGMSSIRLPAAFHEMVDTIAPYYVNVDHPLFEWVDSVITWTDELNMKLIIDNHHLWNLSDQNWRAKLPRFSHLWSVLAQRYSYLDPDRVSFELLNEPTLGFPRDSLMIMFNDAIDSIRQHTTDHSIVVSPHWGSTMMVMPDFEPLADTNLIYTFHCYDPLEFTHQGFTWHVPFFPEGMTFPAGMDTTFFENWLYTGWDRLLAWKQEHQKPIFLGEFGVGSYCDSLSTCNWLEYVGTKLVQNDIPWLYWDWQWGFPMFQSNTVSEDSILPCFKYYLGLYGDDSFTSVNEFEKSEELSFGIYPNPSLDGAISIDLPMGLNGKLYVFDQIGQIIYSENLTGTSVGLNMFLSSGLYLITIETPKALSSRRLVVFR